MSKITNGGLTLSDRGCFTAVPVATVIIIAVKATPAVIRVRSCSNHGRASRVGTWQPSNLPSPSSYR